MQLALLDYGFGNLLALEDTLLALDIPHERVSHGSMIDHFDGVLLTGAGEFGPAMRALEAQGMYSALVDYTEEVRKPILGMGLGCHMLISGSGESPGQPGVNLIPGTARDLPGGVPKPFVGMAAVEWVKRDDPLIAGIPSGSRFHFAQATYIHPAPPAEKHMVGQYSLGGWPAIALTSRGWVWAAQFDPVKSGEAGEQLLRNFADVCQSIADQLGTHAPA